MVALLELPCLNSKNVSARVGDRTTLRKSIFRATRALNKIWSGVVSSLTNSISGAEIREPSPSNWIEFMIHEMCASDGGSVQICKGANIYDHNALLELIGHLQPTTNPNFAPILRESINR